MGGVGLWTDVYHSPIQLPASEIKQISFPPIWPLYRLLGCKQPDTTLTLCNNTILVQVTIVCLLIGIISSLLASLLLLLSLTVYFLSDFISSYFLPCSLHSRLISLCYSLNTLAAPTWVPLYWPLPIYIFKVKNLIFFKTCSSHFLSGPNHPISPEIHLTPSTSNLHCLFYFSFFYNCCCLVTKSCPILWDSMNYNPPASPVLGTFQARILEYIAISFSRGSSQPRDWTCISCIGR